MPWTVADVDKHKKGCTPAEKKRWVEVANDALRRCRAKGGSDCEGSAIRQANSVVGHQAYSVIHYRQEQQRTGYIIREEMYEGRNHLVVPVTMMVEGVHNGSHGPLFHPADELGRFVESWNGIPVLIDHPEEDGVNVSANSPEILEARKVGQIFNAHMRGNRLVAEAWLDEEKLRQLSPLILASVLDGDRLEVSVGVFSDEEETTGTYENSRGESEEYTAVARNHRPDHLALLPGGVGACSIEDGCGLGANNEKGGNDVNLNEAVTGMEKKREELNMSVSEFYAVPRDPPSASKLPIFDEAHVRNAMARFNQTQGLSSAEKATARRKILAKAHHFGIDTSGFEGTQADQELTPEEIQTIKDECMVAAIVDNADQNYQEMVEAARRKLDSMDGESAIHYLEGLYEDFVVFSVRMRVGGIKMFKQSYQYNDGTFELTGNPEEVRKKVEFVSMKQLTLIRNDKSNINNKKEVTKMAENEGCTPCIKAKVDALIANSQGKYTEADREVLETLSEALLDKMAKPIEVEKKVDVFSDEDKAALAAYKKQMKEKRDATIKLIQDNTSKELWPDVVLNGMTDDCLNRLLDSVKKEEAIDYSGRNGINTNAGSAQEHLLPAGVELEN